MKTQKKQEEGSSDMKFKLQKWHIYTLLWMWVMLYPVIHDATDGTFNLTWDDLWCLAVKLAPFMALFLIHDRLIIPRFPVPRKTKGYLLCTVCALAVFSCIQYLHFENEMKKKGPRPDKMMRENRPEFRNGDHPRTADFYDKHKKHRRPRHAKPPRGITPPFVTDTLIAMLMLGFNLTIVLIFRMERENAKVEQMEKANLQHELKYLRAQLKPHFLMNMLNNIHLMIEVNPEKAQEMVIGLSKLMRYTLYEGGKQLVHLSQEVAFTANYVELMQQRLSSRKVDVRIDFPEMLSEHVMIAPLLFIVFVENAFKHGISYRQASYVHIALKLTAGNRVSFSCENSVPPANENATDKTGGIGLENVRKRLNLLFGNDYTLHIKQSETSYTVMLNVPTYDDENKMSGSGR